MKGFYFIVGLAVFMTVHLHAHIHAIAFDFGGVIATTDSSKTSEELIKSFGFSNEELQRGLELRRKESDTASEKGFWEHYAASLGKNVPSGWFERFKEVRIRAIQYVPGMPALIEWLSDLGYQIALLSNTTQDKGSLLRELGYYQPFCPILLSFEIGVKKPNPQAYEILIETLNLPPHEILMIDNASENITAAKQCGLEAILFVSEDQLEKELIQRGILPETPICGIPNKLWGSV